jgi:hypothetical protein
MVKKTISWLWLRYYTVLWCTRCYVWNPVRCFMEHAFDQADQQVRIRVGKVLERLDNPQK